MATIGLLPVLRLARAILCIALAVAIVAQSFSHVVDAAPVAAYAAMTPDAGEESAALYDVIPECVEHGCCPLPPLRGGPDLCGGRAAIRSAAPEVGHGAALALPDKPPRA